MGDRFRTSSQVFNTLTEPLKLTAQDPSTSVQEYGLSLIGRVLFPKKQDVDKVIAYLPKKWDIAGSVESFNLRNGCFLFSFESEEDLQLVLRKGPFHYNYWNLILVRWEPIVHDDYPWDLTFWVQLTGLPLQFWFSANIKRIGEQLGVVGEIDEDLARLQVTIDTRKPLLFSVPLSDNAGNNVNIKIGYDGLFKHCILCGFMTHEKRNCPRNANEPTKQMKSLPLSARIQQPLSLTSSTAIADTQGDLREVLCFTRNVNNLYLGPHQARSALPLSNDLRQQLNDKKLLNDEIRHCVEREGLMPRGKGVSLYDEEERVRPGHCPLLHKKDDSFSAPVVFEDRYGTPIKTTDMVLSPDQPQGNTQRHSALWREDNNNFQHSHEPGLHLLPSKIPQLVRGESSRRDKDFVFSGVDKRSHKLKGKTVSIVSPRDKHKGHSPHSRHLRRLSRKDDHNADILRQLPAVAEQHYHRGATQSVQDKTFEKQSKKRGINRELKDKLQVGFPALSLDRHRDKSTSDLQFRDSNRFAYYHYKDHRPYDKSRWTYVRNKAVASSSKSNAKKEVYAKAARDEHIQTEGRKSGNRGKSSAMSCVGEISGDIIGTQHCSGEKRCLITSSDKPVMSEKNTTRYPSTSTAFVTVRGRADRDAGVGNVTEETLRSLDPSEALDLEVDEDDLLDEEWDSDNDRFRSQEVAEMDVDEDEVVADTQVSESRRRAPWPSPMYGRKDTSSEILLRDSLLSKGSAVAGSSATVGSVSRRLFHSREACSPSSQVKLGSVVVQKPPNRGK